MHWIWSVVAFLTVYSVRTRMSRREPTVYLSFDDGPHPEHTPRLLELLRKHGAKATFFLIGDQAEKHPDIVRRIVEEGHTIGNHSMTHPRLSRLSAREQLADIARADAVLERFNGRKRQMFRPPNGRATLATIVSSDPAPAAAGAVVDRQPRLPARRRTGRREAGEGERARR